MKIQKDIHAIFFYQLLDHALCCRCFFPMWLPRPITIMILRKGIFATITGGGVIYIHDRYNKNLSMLPKPNSIRVIAYCPFSKPLCHPTRSTFPSMLPSLNPDAKSFLLNQVALFHMQHWHCSISQGTTKLRGFSLWTLLAKIVHEFLCIFRGIWRAPCNHKGFSLRFNLVNHPLIISHTFFGMLPCSVINRISRPHWHSP